MKKTIEKELNKWQIVSYFGRDYRVIERGWKEIRFGIINFHQFPLEREMISKKNYRGFILRFFIWFPIDF